MERAGRLIISSIFIIGGMLHFAVPEIYAQIVPPILPHPKALVIISGVAELMGGVGLLLPRCRRAAGCGLALLLVLVFPANIYMAAAHVPATGMLGNCWLQWLRLPLQIPLIWWALHYARANEQGRLSSRANPEKAT
jgi:uncharacterized membrane protein